MFENCGNEATKVRWNQMSRTLNLSWLKVAHDDLMDFWPILGHLGGFAPWRVLLTLHVVCEAEADASSLKF